MSTLVPLAAILALTTATVMVNLNPAENSSNEETVLFSKTVHQDQGAMCLWNNNCPKDQACNNFQCEDPCKDGCGVTNTVCKVTNRRPFCSCLVGYFGGLETGCKEGCKADRDCPDHKACIDSKCEDLCAYTSCGPNAVCNVTLHRVVCKCSPGFFADSQLGCQVGCKSDNECPNSQTCINAKCEDLCIYTSCGANAVCNVTVRSPACTCLSGFIGDAKSGCKRSSAIASYDRYFLYTKQVNWFEAMSLCAKEGLQPASFDNAEEFSKLLTLIKNKSPGGDYWLGGSDLAGKGIYVWLATGEPLSYTPWKSGQPNTVTIESCLDLRTSEGKINTYRCNYLQGFVCQIK